MGKTISAIFNLDGKKIGKIRLPLVFKTKLRPDIIKRAVLAIQSNSYQRQGRDRMAGKRTTAESIGTGYGLARIPRISQGRRAAFAPGTVGGRLAHPPVVEKRIRKKIPKKEKRLALYSAIAATGLKEVVENRGHVIDEVGDFPLIVTDDIENLKHTSEVRDAMLNLGVWADVFRVKEGIKTRAGKGKMRGRRKKTGIGPLFVINENKGIIESANNLPGVNIVFVNNLNVELLAPGTHPGRLTIWSKSSLKELKNLHIRK